MKRGFTLIELLVVIAIIGLLSSIVLASLSEAKWKAKVATAKSALISMREEMELLSDPVTGTYPARFCSCNGDASGINPTFFPQDTWRCPSTSYPLGTGRVPKDPETMTMLDSPNNQNLDIDPVLKKVATISASIANGVGASGHPGTITGQPECWTDEAVNGRIKGWAVWTRIRYGCFR